MNLQQLAVFREVIKTGSVSQAARNLCRTQPAISASLRTLEKELGMDLFLREGRKMVPVPEALYLLNEATEVLERLKTAKQNLISMQKRQTGVLRVVAMPGPSAYLLPEFTSHFISEKPNVQVTLSTRSTPQIRNLIASQSHDVGFCDHSMNRQEENAFNTTLFHCDCLCAVPKSHPLAAKKEITPTDLNDIPMGALQPDHSTYIKTRQAFSEFGARFNLRIDAQYFLPLFHFIEAEQICSVVDVLSAASYLKARGNNAGIVFLPFRPEVRHTYAALTPTLSPISLLAQEFIHLWSKYIQTIIINLNTPQ